jgi:hypothetical protein
MAIQRRGITSARRTRVVVGSLARLLRGSRVVHLVLVLALLVLLWRGATGPPGKRGDDKPPRLPLDSRQPQDNTAAETIRNVTTAAPQRPRVMLEWASTAGILFPGIGVEALPPRTSPLFQCGEKAAHRALTVRGVLSDNAAGVREQFGEVQHVCFGDTGVGGWLRRGGSDGSLPLPAVSIQQSALSRTNGHRYLPQLLRMGKEADPALLEVSSMKRAAFTLHLEKPPVCELGQPVYLWPIVIGTSVAHASTTGPKATASAAAASDFPQFPIAVLLHTVALLEAMHAATGDIHVQRRNQLVLWVADAGASGITASGSIDVNQFIMEAGGSVSWLLSRWTLRNLTKIVAFAPSVMFDSHTVMQPAKNPKSTPPRVNPRQQLDDALNGIPPKEEDPPPDDFYYHRMGDDGKTIIHSERMLPFDRPPAGPEDAPELLCFSAAHVTVAPHSFRYRSAIPPPETTDAWREFRDMFRLGIPSAPIRFVHMQSSKVTRDPVDDLPSIRRVVKPDGTVEEFIEPAPTAAGVETTPDVLVIRAAILVEPSADDEHIAGRVGNLAELAEHLANQRCQRRGKCPLHFNIKGRDPLQVRVDVVPIRLEQTTLASMQNRKTRLGMWTAQAKSTRESSALPRSERWAKTPLNYRSSLTHEVATELADRSRDTLRLFDELAVLLSSMDVLVLDGSLTEHQGWIAAMCPHSVVVDLDVDTSASDWTCLATNARKRPKPSTLPALLMGLNFTSSSWVDDAAGFGGDHEGGDSRGAAGGEPRTTLAYAAALLHVNYARARFSLDADPKSPAACFRGAVDQGPWRR